MNKLFKKSEITFAVLWITVYIIGTGITDALSKMLGIEKLVTLVFYILLCFTSLIWLKKNKLSKEYGLCKTIFPPSKYLFYIPLIILSSVNFWFGVKINMPVYETVFYVGTMICVGFLEEIIFRGFLFKAMAKDNVKTAVIVSSLTFGIGHIVNLINGSGAQVVATICQIVSATAIGYLFIIILHKGKSLFPCIITHSAINVFSAFNNQEVITDEINILISTILCIIAYLYSLFLKRTLN